MLNMKPIFPASTSTKPLAQLADNAIRTRALIKNHLSIKTWLLLGAAIQGALVLLPIRRVYAIAPAFIFLVLQIVDNLLVLFEIKPNPYMDGVIVGKHSAVYPGNDGSFDPKENGGPAGDEITVVFLSARSNHPAGVFSENFRKAGNFISSMNEDLEKHAAEYGWLGGTSWINASDRDTGSEILFVHYFKSLEGLHKFSHGIAHREGWDWYNHFVREGRGKTGFAANTHVAFNHEVYSVPAGRWENIYLNMQRAGFGTTSHAIKDEATGETTWMNGIIDASRSKMRSAAGRLGKDSGSGNEVYGEEPWQEISA